MATLRNRRKLAALNKENCEEHPRSSLARNSNVPISQEDYISQVSKEIEGRVTKKLSREFSRTGNLFLGALFRLDDFLMNPLNQSHSGTAPVTSRNAMVHTKKHKWGRFPEWSSSWSDRLWVTPHKTLAQTMPMTRVFHRWSWRPKFKLAHPESFHYILSSISPFIRIREYKWQCRNMSKTLSS